MAMGLRKALHEHKMLVLDSVITLVFVLGAYIELCDDATVVDVYPLV